MNQVKAISYDTRVTAFWLLLILLTCTAGLYIYAINTTIHNTVTRQTLEEKAALIALRQSSLEFAYIEQKNSINLDLAYSRGFQEVSAPIYVTTSGASSLSFNSR